MHNRGIHIFTFVLIAVTIGYGIFQGRALIDGPILTIHSPAPGETIDSTLFAVTGNTENVTRLEINGRTVTMDTKGNFQEQLVTPDGYGVILVEASNRFGHHRTQRVEFFGAPTENS